MEKPQKPKCAACGNNYTSHYALYITETLGVLMTSLEGGFPNPFTKILYGITSYFEYLNFMIMREIGVVEFIDKEPTFLGRPKVLYIEAKKRGIHMKQLVMLGKDLDYYYVTFPTQKGTPVKMLFRGLPKMLEAPIDSQAWLDDKQLFKKKASESGVPVSRGRSCWTLAEAEKIFDELTKPVIVKPRQGSRGRHTTTWIRTKEELKAAYTSAKQLCACVMIEEHLIGSVYRGTVVDGEVVGVLAGDPPRVSGNGKSTIQELIAEKNKNRPEGISEVVIDEKLENFIGRSGFTLDSVVEKDRTIDLSEKIGVAYGGDARNVTNETHPKVMEYIAKAGALVKDPIIGFDFIIPDIAKDPDTQHWGFIECNGLPFINLHHDARIGGVVNVAEKVWDYVEREIAKKPKKKLWICL